MMITKSKKYITILFGNNDDVKMFLSFDNELNNKYFNFKLIEIMPSIQEIYYEVKRG